MGAGLQVNEGLDNLLQEIDPDPFPERSSQEVIAWKRLDMNACDLPRS